MHIKGYETCDGFAIPEEVCDGIETVGDLVDAALRVMGVRE